MTSQRESGLISFSDFPQLPINGVLDASDPAIENNQGSKLIYDQMSNPMRKDN